MCYVSVFASLRACLCLGSIASQLDCSHDWNPRVVGIQSKLQVTSLCNLQDTIWYGLQSFALYKAMKFAPICRSWRQWCNFENANREQRRPFRKHCIPRVSMCVSTSIDEEASKWHVAGIWTFTLYSKQDEMDKHTSSQGVRRVLQQGFTRHTTSWARWRLTKPQKTRCRHWRGHSLTGCRYSCTQKTI